MSGFSARAMSSPSLPLCAVITVYSGLNMSRSVSSNSLLSSTINTFAVPSLLVGSLLAVLVSG